MLFDKNLSIESYNFLQRMDKTKITNEKLMKIYYQKLGEVSLDLGFLKEASGFYQENLKFKLPGQENSKYEGETFK